MGRWTQVLSDATNAANDAEGDRSPAATTPDAKQLAAMAMFDAKLASLAQRERAIIGRRNMWLAHHWPEDYAERCITIGGRHVCRRCAALYPLGLVIAILSSTGRLPWPDGIDPAAIWLLSVPATVAYCGEALGLFAYNAKVQVATTLLAAVAFGRALGYEFTQRWSAEFWGPIFFFGLIWFLATAIGLSRKRSKTCPDPE